MSGLTPNRFREQLDAAMPRSDFEGSAGTSVDGDIAEGKAMLRRRRTTATVLVCVIVATIAVGSAVVFGTNEDPGTQRPMSPTDPDSQTANSRADQELIDNCRAAGERDRRYLAPGSARQLTRFFAAQGPIVKLHKDGPAASVAVLESRDGRLWAQCFVERANGEPAELFIAPAGEWTRYGSRSESPFCPKASATDCRDFQVQFVEHLPQRVAALRVETIDGRVAEVDSDDGFFAFNYVGLLPSSAPRSTEEWLEVPAVTRIDFLDSRGESMAADRYDAAGGTTRVPGLPTLEEWWPGPAADGQ